MKNKRKKILNILLINLVFVGCAEKKVKIPYENNSINKCSKEKIFFYRKIINETPMKEELKKIIINLDSMQLKYSNNFSNNKEIELYNFNDTYTVKENLCESADIRYENFLKINNAFKEIGYKKGFKEWANYLATYIRSIDNENKIMNDWENDYLTKIKENNKLKPLNIIIYNKTGDKLNFNIKDLNIHWKYTKDEKDLDRELKENITLIDIKPISSKEYILNNIFQRCDLIKKNCISYIKQSNNNLLKISMSNKNKMIKFKKLLEDSMNKYKSFPYITSVLGEDKSEGIFKNNFIKLQKEGINTIGVIVEKHYRKKIIPKYIRARDYNVSAIIKGNLLTIINKSRSNIVVDNIILTNAGQEYHLNKSIKIPYNSEYKINLENYKEYINSIYHIFKNKKEMINNTFEIYLEYKKQNYKKPYYISNKISKQYQLFKKRVDI